MPSDNAIAPGAIASSSAERPLSGVGSTQPWLCASTQSRTSFARSMRASRRHRRTRRRARPRRSAAADPSRTPRLPERRRRNSRGVRRPSSTTHQTPPDTWPERPAINCSGPSAIGAPTARSSRANSRASAAMRGVGIGFEKQIDFASGLGGHQQAAAKAAGDAPAERRDVVLVGVRDDDRVGRARARPPRSPDSNRAPRALVFTPASSSNR